MAIVIKLLHRLLCCIFAIHHISDAKTYQITFNDHIMGITLYNYDRRLFRVNYIVITHHHYH